MRFPRSEAILFMGIMQGAAGTSTVCLSVCVQSACPDVVVVHAESQVYFRWSKARLESEAGSQEVTLTTKEQYALYQYHAQTQWVKFTPLEAPASCTHCRDAAIQQIEFWANQSNKVPAPEKPCPRNSLGLSENDPLCQENAMWYNWYIKFDTVPTINKGVVHLVLNSTNNKQRTSLTCTLVIGDSPLQSGLMASEACMHSKSSNIPYGVKHATLGGDCRENLQGLTLAEMDATWGHHMSPNVVARDCIVMKWVSCVVAGGLTRCWTRKSCKVHDMGTLSAAHQLLFGSCMAAVCEEQCVMG